MIPIRLTDRQEQIIKIVKEQGPIKGEEIADKLGYVRATLRPDLTVRTKSGVLEARPRVGYFYNAKGINSRVFEEINKIKVKEGNFENFEGEVAKIDEASGRVTVLIHIFGRSTQVELEYWQIEAV